MAIDIRRREFVGGLGGVVFGWPLAANAQQPNRARKLGILMPLAENDPESQRRIAALLQMLRQFGWVDGKTIVIETRFAGGNPESLPTLASELVRAKVDVIVTQAAQPVEALRAATTTIPIVMASVGDALGAGYVASLAHPGGNITGLTLVATDQSTKRLQLIKELLPTILRIAVLSNANAAGHRLQLKEMEPSAATLGLSLLSLPVQKADDIDPALRAATDAGAQAIIPVDPVAAGTDRRLRVEAASAGDGRISFHALSQPLLEARTREDEGGRHRRRLDLYLLEPPRGA